MIVQAHKELSTLVSICVSEELGSFGCFHWEGAEKFLVLLFIQSTMFIFSVALAASLSLTPLYKQPSIEIRYTYTVEHIQV